MKIENKINCPECGAHLDIDEVLFHQIEERTKKSLDKELQSVKNDYEVKIAKKEEEVLNSQQDLQKKIQQLEVENKSISDQVQTQVEEKISGEKAKFEAERKKIEQEKQVKIQELESERKTISEQIEAQVKQKISGEKAQLKAEKEKIEQEKQEYIDKVMEAAEEEARKVKEKLQIDIGKEYNEKHTKAMDVLKNEIIEKSEKLKELDNAKLEIEKVKLEKMEMKVKIVEETEDKMNRILKEEKAKFIELEQTKNELKIIEKDKMIDQIKNDLKDANRRMEQGSVQLQGEAQEIAIEDYLKETFPMDSIEEIKKGARGADCLQIINTPGREDCGSIYYESKRTKKFGGDWVEKFRNDMREKDGVSVGILVTEAMPNDMPKMGMRNGIWICNYTEFKGLSIALRESVIQLSSAVVSQENKGGKMAMVYDYLISNEFKMIVESIVEAYSDMKSDLEREKRSLQGHWKRREKQIERVSVNVLDMYSSLKGIAGNSVQSVDALEYENMDSEIYELEEKVEVKSSKIKTKKIPTKSDLYEMTMSELANYAQKVGLNIPEKGMSQSDMIKGILKYR